MNPKQTYTLEEVTKTSIKHLAEIKELKRNFAIEKKQEFWKGFFACTLQGFIIAIGLGVIYFIC